MIIFSFKENESVGEGSVGNLDQLFLMLMGIIILFMQVKLFSGMASKPITIRWIRTGFQSDRKIMYSIELKTIFCEY